MQQTALKKDFMKLYKIFMSLSLVINSAYAIDDIETIKHKVQTTLAKKNPQILGEYQAFSQQYDQLVLDFFDAENHKPLKTHVENIGAAMRTLKQTYENPEFVSVRPILMTYYKHGSALVRALKGYIGSRNTVGLVFRLRHFVFLLPKVVRQKGAFSLLRGLNHRLRCM